MKHKRLVLIAVFALLITLVGTGAVSQQTAFAHSGGGTGTLTASGSGLAGIRGSGNVTISGNGILWIKDYAGDANIHVSGNGVRHEMSNGWIRYTGFRGQAQVSGSDISVALSGYDIHLVATGSGRFLLRGNGEYSVESDGVVIIRGQWTERGKVLTLP